MIFATLTLTCQFCLPAGPFLARPMDWSKRMTNRRARGAASDSSTLLIIGTMVVAAFIMILNETIVSIALPDLAETLDVSTSSIQWLVSGFLVTMGVIIPITGFLLDRFAPRHIFLAALSAFTIGTLICAAAPNFGVLLGGRIVQASGTAVVLPLLMTSVMRLIPAERRGSMMGTISIVIGVAPALGPTVGGAVLAALTWRWMFWIVLALALVLLAIGFAKLHVPVELRPVPLDVLSVILSALGFAGLVYGLSAIGQTGGPVPPWDALVVSGVALVLFVSRQIALQRIDRPLLDLRVLLVGRFRLGLIMSIIVFMALLGAGAVILPVYLQRILLHEPFIAGLSLLPGGLAMAAISRPAGSFYDRFGARPLVIPGAIGMTAALWCFALLGADAPLGLVIACHVLMMFSLGLMMTPLMADALGALPDRLTSHGSAIFATLQQVAGALGAAFLVAVAAVASQVKSEIPDGRGLAAGFGLAACFGLLAVFVAPRFKKLPNVAPSD